MGGGAELPAPTGAPPMQAGPEIPGGSLPSPGEPPMPEMAVPPASPLPV